MLSTNIKKEKKRMKKIKKFPIWGIEPRLIRWGPIVLTIRLCQIYDGYKINSFINEFIWFNHFIVINQFWFEYRFMVKNSIIMILVKRLWIREHNLYDFLAHPSSWCSNFYQLSAFVAHFKSEGFWLTLSISRANTRRWKWNH
jgi:hypothetical protein